MKTDKKHDKAIRIVTDLETNKKNIFLISHLTILELHEVIRKRTIERAQFEGISSSIRNKLKKEADDIVTNVNATFLALGKEGKMRMATPEKKLIEYLVTILGIFSSIFPELDKKTYCHTCEQVPPKELYKIVGVGHYDVQHAVNAKEFAADEIISFDRGFQQLKTISDFNKMKVTIY